VDSRAKPVSWTVR